MDPTTEVAWNTLVELRKGILQAHRIRAQMIGFKITFVGAAVGLILANNVDVQLLAVPAFAAVFFDFLICSHSVAIKRKGKYCRWYIEPKLRVYASWPGGEPLWEEFISYPEKRQRLSVVGNLGLTVLAVASAGVGLSQSTPSVLTIAVAAALLVLFVLDFIFHLMPGWIAEARPRENGGVTDNKEAG